jgi:hypothetical protein
MSGKIIEGAVDPNEFAPLPDVVEHKVERPCGHMQVILGPASSTTIDYAKYVAPFLRAEIEKPCEECAKLV